MLENPQIISVHEYELRSGVEGIKLERAFQEAKTRGLFELPGLVTYHLIKGIRGVRRGKYGALWIYESLGAWERLWGPVDRPIAKEEYPQKWLTWENEFLAPLLSQDADQISYTSYLVLDHINS